jgi:hypothetical protein
MFPLQQKNATIMGSGVFYIVGAEILYAEQVSESWSWISRRLKPEMTVLAKVSSNLTDRLINPVPGGITGPPLSWGI